LLWWFFGAASRRIEERLCAKYVRRLWDEGPLFNLMEAKN